MRNLFRLKYEHFVQIDEHFVQIEEHFFQIDVNVLQIDEHFVQIDEHFVQIDNKKISNRRTFFNEDIEGKMFMCLKFCL